jgi:hypothetical protein
MKDIGLFIMALDKPARFLTFILHINLKVCF